MFDAQQWARRLAGEDCPVCTAADAAADPHWLATLPSGHVLLPPDGDFPGYCILYFRRHVSELSGLTPDERHQLVDDIERLARAVTACCKPAKLNYACLGNEVPHLHWHVVPRYPHDGWWGQAFSLRPTSARRTLPEEEYERLRQNLRMALAGQTSSLEGLRQVVAVCTTRQPS